MTQITKGCHKKEDKISEVDLFFSRNQRFFVVDDISAVSNVNGKSNTVSIVTFFFINCPQTYLSDRDIIFTNILLQLFTDN